MESIRKPARWLVWFAALALLAVACGPDAQAPTTQPTGAGAGSETEGAQALPTGEPVDGGTVVYGSDQEPAVLNPVSTEGNVLVTTKVTTNILPRAYTVTPEFDYRPDVLVEDATFTEDPFTITYKIKPEAVWSDGTPISAEDFKFTWQSFIDEDNDIASRAGYELIESVEAVDEKTAKVTFKQNYAPWKDLFSPILPKHELEDKNLNKVWNDEITISGGPFMFESWDKGTQLEIVRNDEYWGEKAKLDSILFRFIPDSNTLVQQLRGGEIDMMDPQPQLDLVDQVGAIEGIVSESSLGAQWEHIDFNTRVKPLDQPYVRQAIMMGIDRQLITDQLITPINPDAEPLDNVIWLTNQEEYEPHWDKFGYDPAKAVALLEQNGCTREGEGTFECEGEPLSFRIRTTGGNELRELTEQIVQQQLAAIGVEIEIDNAEGAEAFSVLDKPDSEVCGGNGDGKVQDGEVCDFDLFLFAWVGSPDPGGSNEIWRCDGDQNYTVTCSEEATELLDMTDAILDPQKRAEVYNAADAALAELTPTVPLYQKPTFFAWKDSIVGPADNPTNQTIFWNSAEWALTE
ncbi:MAG: ABC transporter family substrate-binding protein [Actinomycetota bacterium]|nr:ABC transporter family substrate-binding protein [Actinomycetota bacterium]